MGFHAFAGFRYPSWCLIQNALLSYITLAENRGFCHTVIWHFIWLIYEFGPANGYEADPRPEGEGSCRVLGIQPFSSLRFRLDLHQIPNPTTVPTVKLIGPTPNIHASGACPKSVFVWILVKTIQAIKTINDAPAATMPHLKHVPIQSENEIFNLNRCRSR